MTESEIKLKLLANIPVHVEGIGDFQLPTIRRVIELGENAYYESLSRVLFSKDQLSSPTEDVAEYSDMDVLKALMFHDISFRSEVFHAFNLFFDKEPHMSENGLIYFGELNEESILTDEKWDLIKKIARIGNFIGEKKEEEYDFATEEAKSFWEKLKKKRELASKLKKEEQVNLHSIISAVGWKTNSFFDVLGLTVYQLYDAYYRLSTIDNYNFTLTGIYTGNVDSSKIKLPDINWANVIKIN